MADKTEDGKYLTIPMLAQYLKISEATVRRYIKNYSEFFESYMKNGWEYYEAEKTAKIIRTIADIGAVGRKSRIQVRSALEKEFETAGDVSEAAEDSEVAESSEGHRKYDKIIVEFGNESMTVLKSIRDSLIKIAGK